MKATIEYQLEHGSHCDPNDREASVGWRLWRFVCTDAGRVVEKKVVATFRDSTDGDHFALHVEECHSRPISVKPK